MINSNKLKKSFPKMKTLILVNRILNLTQKKVDMLFIQQVQQFLNQYH